MQRGAVSDEVGVCVGKQLDGRKCEPLVL